MTSGPSAYAGRATSYDLRSAPQISPRGSLVVRILCLLGILVLGGIILLEVGLAAIAGTLGTISGGVATLIGVAAVAVVLCGFIFLGMGQPAITCLWDNQGFVLQYRNGRSQAFHWLDPRLRIEISVVTYKGRTECDLTTRMPFHNYVTQELLQAILSEANRRGLDVQTRNVSSTGATVRTHKIRATQSPRRSAR